MSWAVPQIEINALIEPRPSPIRPRGRRERAEIPDREAESEQQVPGERLSTCVRVHRGGVDCVASTVAPMIAKARMPSMVNRVRARNAASKAVSEWLRNERSRAASPCVALTMRTPSTLSWIHDVSRLLVSRARRNAVLSLEENLSPR